VIKKCKYCGDFTTGEKPEGIKVFRFGKYEINIIKWVSQDICEDCLSDLLNEPRRESFDAGAEWVIENMRKEGVI
jgi:hypothetical protein